MDLDTEKKIMTKEVIIRGLILFGLGLLAGPSAGNAKETQDYDYVTNADNTITITLYTGSGGAVAIPSTITSLSVMVIGTNAFANVLSLTNVAIPDSVTVLGVGAFSNCEYLTSLVIPNSVTNMGDSAFAQCLSLTNAIIGDGITSIAARAFLECWQLTSVTIPGGVTSIGDQAFGHCSELPSLTIPTNVTSIGDSAFEGCLGLTNLTIPASVTNIGDSAFSHCFLTSVTIPKSITSIGNSVFAECAFLSKVTIPDTVTSLGDDAFVNCNSLTSVTIPNSVTNFAADAFQGCPLTSIYFLDDAPGIIPYDGPNLGSLLQGTVYYLPGATGWSNSFDFCPAVLWNPLIQTGDGTFGVRNNQFGFNITGTSNIPIVVEACTNLASQVWTPLQSLTLTNGSYYFSEPFQPVSAGRYYRISSQ